MKLEKLKNDNSEAGAHSGKQASDSQPDPNPPLMSQIVMKYCHFL